MITSYEYIFITKHTWLEKSKMKINQVIYLVAGNMSEQIRRILTIIVCVLSGQNTRSNF